MTKEYTDPGPIQFEAIIQRNELVNNSATYVHFPFDLKETFGVGNLVPFKATFDGKVIYRGSLAKMGGPQAMILLTKETRDKLRKRPGDTVSVIVELDDKPRQLIIATDINQALFAANLWEFFAKLAYSHRKEYVDWVEDAKRPETRDRRIKQMVDSIKQAKQAS